MRHPAAIILFAAIVVAGGAVAPAVACSVCQGDPDSGLTKGAEAGVILMVVVTYAVLLSFAGIIAMWFVRARRIRAIAAGPPREASATDSPDP